MDNISGKNIAITGAARGIGYATAATLLRRGARVVIGDRDVEALGLAARKLAEEGNVFTHPLDVTNTASFNAFLQAAKNSGPLDVLINNAGVMPIGPFLSTTSGAIRSMLEVNLYGVINGCQLALLDMVERHSGQIVNIASLAGITTAPGIAVYNASKFGVVGLTRALYDEFAPQGIQISCILPNFTNTDLISGTEATGVMRPIQPEDTAAAVVQILQKPSAQVIVPRAMGLVVAILKVAPAGLRRTLNAKLGVDRVFLDFDSSARSVYESRAQSSLGLAEVRHD